MTRGFWQVRWKRHVTQAELTRRKLELRVTELQKDLGDARNQVLLYESYVMMVYVKVERLIASLD